MAKSPSTVSDRWRAVRQLGIDWRGEPPRECHSIASNHAFVDGNKRTAVMATVAFCGFNGVVLDADDTDLIHLAVDVAIGNLEVPTIAEHLSKWARPLPDASE